MNAIDLVFKKKQAFVGFVVGGDGGMQYCIDCCLQMVEGGVDILEIGFPFSEPVADGPVIQRASERSLKEGTTSSTLLEIARGIRKKSPVPLVLFSYYNPLLRQGSDYLKDLKSAGFDAVLVLDLPPPTDGNIHPYFQALQEAGLCSIFVVAPSTSTARLLQIVKNSQGFIYYACQKGITGARDQLPEDVPVQVARIRKATNLPIVVGFGIADATSVRAALKEADGFVVGSAFVKLMEQKEDPTKLKILSQKLRGDHE